MSAPARQRPIPTGLRPLAFEGLFQSVAQSLVESWLAAYALVLGASGPVLGLIPALPTASTAGAQAFAHRLALRARRTRRFLAECWATQAVGYAAIGCCAFLPEPVALLLLAPLTMLAFAAGGICVPAWTALIARRARGAGVDRFFASRGMAQQLGVLTAILAGGFTLSAFRGRGLEAAGFATLFGVAGLLRLAGSSLLLAVPPERGMPRGQRPRLPALRSLRRATTFRRLAVHLWFLHLATHVATPFFVPYMVAELGLSYATIGLLLSVPATVKFTTLRLWARVADGIGPGPLLRRAGLFLPVVSTIWLVAPNVWIILAAQILSGLVWGAFELAQASSLLRTTRGRESSIALFNLIDGGAILLGSLLGGVLVELARAAGLPLYLTPIAVSSALRAFPVAAIVLRVRGIGRPAWSHLRIPLRLWSVRPTRGPSFRPWGAPPPEPAGSEEAREDD